ncbi:DUF397 domain-containing protein [Halostreptopolyspora alba]|uniref:DUF397 domain-containing protein n=1 Tax=Halostreptopolyspora alba TaxID=2487137 RepID=A0A3N0EBU9_9ACTN|nr:DUF397 domain-containing protein [Nocardiopsaceae bacterium YIM 96095]
MISVRYENSSPLRSWYKSSYSGYNSNCVEVAHHPGGIAVRDSKAPHATHLEFDRASWVAFLAQERHISFLGDRLE